MCKRRGRIAAAVLAVVVNMAGTALNASDTWVSDDDDDSPDDGADVVDVRHAHDSPGHRGALRGAAAAVCGEPVDAAWAVTCADGRGAAVVVQDDSADFVSDIDLDVERDCPLWPGVLAKALAHCHERHALKAIIRVEGVAPSDVRSVTEPLGFSHSRDRWVDGERVSEFYADIYRRSESSSIVGTRARASA